MTDELAFSFERVLIEDVIWATEQHGYEDNQANRRNVTRAIFTAIEGLAWLTREHVRDVAESMGDLSPLAALAMREMSYQVDSKGRLTEQVRYIALPALIRLTVEQAKLMQPGLTIDFSDSGWLTFNKAIVVRNRVTHPKSKSDLHVSDPDLKVLRVGFSWILATCLDIMMSVNVAHIAFNRDMRDLLDRLKIGDPEALALYQAAIGRNGDA